MKTSLLLCAFAFMIMSANAQYSTRSTISFNYVKGLNTQNQNVLDSIYHNMSDQNYHCFNLVNDNELTQLQQTKLLRLIKSRASKIIDYYTAEQHVETENIFIKYGGRIPTLWLRKPVSELTVSGEIILEDKNRQCFSFNPSVDKMITAASGNKFYFPLNAFETLKGHPIGSQNIDICVWEFMDQKSLIFSGLTTDANGKMLETAGSYFIEAKLNGEELRLSPGEAYTVEMSADRSFPDMFTYYGGNKSGLIDWTGNPDEPAVYTAGLDTPVPESGNGMDKVVETEGLNLKMEQFYNANTDDAQEMVNYNDNRNISKAYQQSVQAVDFYEMSAGKLGWINCDRFYEVKNKTTLAVRLDTDSNMVVRIVFKDINSVMPAYSNSNHKDQYQASGIPFGEKVIVLAYSVTDEDAIFGYKEITIGENEIENISLNNLSKSRFDSAVSELLSF